LPARLEADTEARRIQAYLGAHDPGEHDVARTVLHRVGPIDPMLLHQHGLAAKVGRDGGDLTGVVRLIPADRYEGVRALSERIGHEVLELQGLGERRIWLAMRRGARRRVAIGTLVWALRAHASSLDN